MKSKTLVGIAKESDTTGIPNVFPARQHPQWFLDVMGKPQREQIFFSDEVNWVDPKVKKAMLEIFNGDKYPR